MPAPAPGELLLDMVLIPEVGKLLDVLPLLVVDMDIELLALPAAPLVPNSAVPVSSNWLRGGVGTVSAAPLPFAAEVELPEDVVGAQDAAAPAARLVLPTLAVPVPVLVVPLLVLAVPVPVLVVRELVPLVLLVLPRAAAAVPVELVPVLTVAVPVELVPPLAVLIWLPDAVLLLPAVVDPWQAASPTETTSAGTMVR